MWHMNWQDVHRTLKSDYLKLLPIMGLAYYVAFIPHRNYLYPVHIDEWFHMAFSNEIIGIASVVGFTNPFSGGAPVWNQSFELGFHVFFAVFHQISGIPWIDIVRYFPGIIFIITILSVYVLAKRQGFGWEAALFTCLVPTTVGILGPAFMVPVAMGLLFIPLSIFLVFNFRTGWSYVVLFLLTVFLVSMHAATAVGIAIILTPFILLNLKGNFKHSLGITLALAIPFIAIFPWVFDMLLQQVRSLLIPSPVTRYVDIPSVIQTYGYLPILSCLLGTFLLAMRGDKRNCGLILGLLALLMILTTYFTFHYGVPSVYERGLVYMMLLMSIVAGAGLMGVKNFMLPVGLSTRLRAPLITKNIGNILCLILIGFTLAVCIPERQNIPYYYMINKRDYQTFVWIKYNVSESYDKAILDPWKATAFTATTGKKVYTRIHMNPKSSDNWTYEFLEDGCKDSAFLRENRISIVYTREAIHNSDLLEVRKNVYLLKEIK